VSTVAIKPLRADLPYGARVSGITFETLQHDTCRKRLAATLVDRGMIVFEDVEQSSQMQVEISNVFGPLKDHPVKSVERVDQDAMPGVIVISTDGGGAQVEVGGRSLVTWQPWHFDHCYNDELNYAGVLRTVVRPRELGFTGFADGIQIWKALPEDIRQRIEGREVIYTLDLLYSHMKFPVPGVRVLRDSDSRILEVAKTIPRAIHPAVWQRPTGEKIFHMAPWMAFGIAGNETPEGDQLFEDAWDAALAVMKPYAHEWKGTEMLIWDNSRMLHRGMGCGVRERRVIHRTTIQGDYGHGHWETAGSVALAQDVM
jgi:taurine dioxygenase